MASTNADDGEAAVKWYVVDESGGLLGPFSTTELAVQAQSGQLTGDQQLRKVGSSVTVAARRLVFLKFPAQAASPKKTGVSSPARSSREPLQRSVAADNDVNGVESIDPEEDSAEPARRGPWSQSISDQIGSKFLILSVGLVLGFFAGGWWNSQPDIFPAPPGHVTEAGNVVVRKEDSRPAKPQILTLRNVPKDRRVPLPGLEGIDPAFSPTLTPDLKTLIFAGFQQESAYDLFISTRDDINQPFRPPVPIQTCSSKHIDAYPSLTPDGLQLVFIRTDKKPRIMFTKRASASDSFEVPDQLELGQFDMEETEVMMVHFPTELELVLLVRSQKASGLEVLQASRKSATDEFQTPRKMAFADPTPPYRLSSDFLRAYFGFHKGIWMASRTTLDGVFQPSQSIFDVDLTGEIDGPIYFGPKEDVFIFCGPAEGKKVRESRQLWMIQP